MTIPRYAIIPTHDRTEQVTALVKSLREQGCDQVVVIDNDTTPVLSKLWFRAQCGNIGVTISRYDKRPPELNLSEMWNKGLQLIELTAKIMREQAWNVAILNDDAVLPDGWLDYVCNPLDIAKRDSAPAVSCTYPYGNVANPLLKTQPDHNINTRMCPWAFVTRGELRLRADESMKWWYSDTDWDWVACQSGGVLLLPGYTTQNTGANSTTVGELAEQAGRDGLTFQAKWGNRPW